MARLYNGSGGNNPTGADCKGDKMPNRTNTLDAGVCATPVKNSVRDVIAANFGTFFEWFDLLVYR